MTKAPPGVHPKWISHFMDDGTYIDDPGEEFDQSEMEVDIRTFQYRNGEVMEEGTYVQQDFRDVLKDLGF